MIVSMSKIARMLEDRYMEVCGVTYVEVEYIHGDQHFKGLTTLSEAKLRLKLQELVGDKTEEVMELVQAFSTEQAAEREIE